MTGPKDRWLQPTGGALPVASGQPNDGILALARTWSRLPFPAVVSLKRIGEIQIQPDEIAMSHDAAQIPNDDMAWFRLARAAEQAWLGVSLDACHGLLRAVLGGAAPLSIRPLCSAEKGLMTAILVSAVNSLGFSSRATLAPANDRPSRQAQQVLLGGTVMGGMGIEGRVLFVGPLSWLDEGFGSPMLQTPKTEIEGVLELGRTALLASDLATAQPGDAVAFDGVPCLVSGSTWPVNLVVGRSWRAGNLSADNSLKLTGAWADGDETPAPQNCDSRWEATRLGPSDKTDSAGTTVDVIAELGRIKLRGNELAGLFRGGTLSLGPRPSDHIYLRVGSQLWATGAVVGLGEQLGVRILRLHGCVAGRGEAPEEGT